MSKLLEGKVAIVTGAGRGIGRAIALALARQGADVALAARTEADLMAVKAEIEHIARTVGGQQRALVVPTDVADECAVRNLVAATHEAFGRLDIVINNAGAAVKAPLAGTSTEDWDRLMAVNARGPFLVCREAIPLMRAVGSGFIVNVASVVGVKGYADQAAYSASKHALVGMTEALAQEVKPFGIRVHLICPGGVATDMVKHMRPDIDAADLIAPEEVAEIVLFLLTQRGNAVIDQVNVRRAASGPWF